MRPELLVELLPAIREARDTGLTARRAGLRLDDARDVTIEVVPLTGSRNAPLCLILFNEGPIPEGSVRARPPAVAVSESEKDRRIAQLERELDGMRDFVRGTIEEHGSVTEELRSAHEEMLSANEEFQSTNEELETSKEELQSTNEELATTNEELRNRNRELGGLNNELDKTRVTSDRARAFADIIIETVREPLLVLDGEQRIQRVNQSFLTDLAIPREDVEHHFIHEVRNGLLDIPELRQRLRAASGSDAPIEN